MHPRASSQFRPDLEDRWRWGTRRARTPAKEWQHVIVFGRGFELLVNFNLQTAPETLAQSARVIVLLRSAAWTGFIDDVAPSEVHVSADGTVGRFGRHALHVGERHYRLLINAPERDFFADLVLEPVALPMIARSQEIAPGRRLDWTMVPRMTARGELIVGGASAYHDHNWGSFAWGDDFSWEWAVAAADDGEPWTAVYSALRSRSGGVVGLRQIFLWNDTHNVLAASGVDTRADAIRGESTEAPYRLPAPLALLSQPLGADLPRRIELHADHPAGWLDLALDFSTRCELLIPSDRDPLGLVILHERSARAAATGSIDRQPFSWTGRAVFELLSS